MPIMRVPCKASSGQAAHLHHARLGAKHAHACKHAEGGAVSGCTWCACACACLQSCTLQPHLSVALGSKKQLNTSKG